MIFKSNGTSIYDIKDKIDENDNLLSQNKGIYKFYIKEDLLDLLVNKLTNPSLINLLKGENFEVIRLKDDNKIDLYYCVYVGKTNANNGFLSRVVNSHIKGSVNNSTLRKSIVGILGKSNVYTKNLTQTLRKECIFLLAKTYPVNDNITDLEESELKEINNKFIHILNLDDNGFYLKDSQHIDILLEIQRLRDI